MTLEPDKMLSWQDVGKAWAPRLDAVLPAGAGRDRMLARFFAQLEDAARKGRIGAHSSFETPIWPNGATRGGKLHAAEPPPSVYFRASDLLDFARGSVMAPYILSLAGALEASFDFRPRQELGEIHAPATPTFRPAATTDFARAEKARQIGDFRHGDKLVSLAEISAGWAAALLDGGRLAPCRLTRARRRAFFQALVERIADGRIPCWGDKLVAEALEDKAPGINRLTAARLVEPFGDRKDLISLHVRAGDLTALAVETDILAPGRLGRLFQFDPAAALEKALHAAGGLDAADPDLIPLVHRPAPRQRVAAPQMMQ